MSLPPALGLVHLRAAGDRLGRRAAVLRLRRLEEQVEQFAVHREQEHAAVVAEDALVLVELLEEGVELRVLAVGGVADAVGLLVGPAFLALFFGSGVGQDVADAAGGGALDVLGLLLALAAVVGHLLVALAADALEDGVADLRRV